MKNRKLRKYWAVFKISFRQEFAYKLNFVMWRFRNVMQIVIVFYFWNSLLLGQQKILFGYDKSKILTYVFMVAVVRAIVLSARAVDIAGQIGNGDLTNFLLKPVSFSKYWLSRDLASKSLNLIFSLLEISILYLLLRPSLYLPANILTFFGFGISILLAVFVFYYLLFIVNMVAFWMPENSWAAQFLFIVIITEFLSGGLFPIDIFPKLVQQIMSFLPFQYLLYFPIQIYLGKIIGIQIVWGFVITTLWLFVLWFLTQKIWRAGLRIYSAEGR